MKHFMASLCLSLVPATASAEWVRATGTYLFPPEMSEAEACQYAEERARASAIVRVVGETVSAEDTLRCSEQGGEAECMRNATTWSTVSGYIKDVRGLATQTPAADTAGHRECVVTMEADVRGAKGRPDPGFTVSVSLNQEVFRDGEILTMSLSPSQRMAVQVFQWLPYRRDGHSVSRIFPNALDPANVFETSATIPTEAGTPRYLIKVAFPEGMPPRRKMVDEHLIIIATIEPMHFQEAYSLDDFRRLLAEIPGDKSRIVRKSYNIIRGNS